MAAGYQAGSPQRHAEGTLGTEGAG